MANDTGCRCGHKDLFDNEKRRCFAYRGGLCDALKENCRNADGRCKFFKTKEKYLEELKFCAKRLNYNFDDYINACGLKSVIAILTK